MSKPINKDSWSNKTLTIRLAGDRARKLKAIANAMDAGATPYHALDHSIDIAEAEVRGFGHHDKELDEISDKLSDISAGVVHIGVESTKGAGDHSAIMQRLDEMHRFLALLAGSAAGDSEGNEPMPISDWLNRIAEDEPNLQFLLARATWQGLERRGESKADLDVLVERVATKQDAADARIKRPPSVVRLGRVLAGIDAHAKILFQDFYIACQRNSDGRWKLTIREIGPQGSLGPATLFTVEQ